MTNLVDRILNLDPMLVYLVVPALVFAEDALFVGFVIPGETAAILGGVLASRGRVNVEVLAALVVLAAVLGDTVGYEVGRHLGGRALQHRILDGRRDRILAAQEFLRRRGGAAVFLGRFIAFFRAVMPALAGTARMPYLTFLVYNAAGGVVWGVGFVLLGYLAGNSYQRVAKTVGTSATIVAVVLILLALGVWHFRKREQHDEAAPEEDPVGGNKR